MLQFITRNRAFSALIAAGVLLLFVTVRMFLNSRPAPVGEFTLPAMAGWKRQINDKGSSRQVNYRKNVLGNELFIGLGTLNSAGQPPKTLQEMQNNHVKSRQDIAAIAAQAGVQGQLVEAAPPQLSTINGLPAVIITEAVRGRSRTSYKYLLFVKGGHSYTLMASTTVPFQASSYPEADEALSEAWQKLTSLIR